MALVADSVTHLFSPRRSDHHDYADHSSTRSGTSTSSESRARAPSHSRSSMTSSGPSRQSHRASDEEEDDDDDVTPTPGPGKTLEQEDEGAGDNMDTSPTQSEDDRQSATLPSRVQVRDLAHIQSLAASDMQHQSRSKADGGRSTNPQYDISAMPIENIIEMVAGLLTKITTTNDMQHEHLHRQMPNQDDSSKISPQTSSVLAFHGKNVPSITILSYLNRINKYCPTSYEVFLSLLVYFDRMTEKVNAGPIQNLKDQNQQQSSSVSTVSEQAQEDEQMKDAKGTQRTQTATPPASGTLDTQEQGGAIPGTPHSKYKEAPSSSARQSVDADLDLAHFFVVDSFNIHRLVIAGVTCASKFFSDIFYTNSRYAKVGGLPLPELNHLELQFLLLNDFRLSVPVEELEAYGTMLVEFYAREATSQNQQVAAH